MDSKRLCEKCEKYSGEKLHDVSILKRLLKQVCPSVDSNACARALMVKFVNLRNILTARESELKEVCGISSSAAQLFVLLHQLYKRILIDKLKNTTACLENGGYIEYLMLNFDHAGEEKLEIILFDVSGRVITNKTNDGLSSQVVFDNNDIVSFALEYKAAYVIISHNHLHGKLSWSDADIKSTQNLAKALDVVNVKLYDHILVVGNKCLSYRNDSQV